jgi:hypothetical protein
MGQTDVSLVPLATMTLRLRAPLILDPAPCGLRWIAQAESGRLAGDRLTASLTGQANADWFAIGPGGTGTVDARLTVETDDGALVLLEYNGRADVSAGAPEAIYIAPRFESGDERYRWLNLVQAVGKGTFVDPSTLVYELFEVR